MIRSCAFLFAMTLTLAGCGTGVGPQGLGVPDDFTARDLDGVWRWTSDGDFASGCLNIENGAVHGMDVLCVDPAADDTRSATIAVTGDRIFFRISWDQANGTAVFVRKWDAVRQPDGTFVGTFTTSLDFFYDDLDPVSLDYDMIMERLSH